MARVRGVTSAMQNLQERELYEPHSDDPKSELFLACSEAMESFYLAQAFAEIGKAGSLPDVLSTRCMSCFFLNYGAIWCKNEPFSLRGSCKDISREIDAELAPYKTVDAIRELREGALLVRNKFIAHRLESNKYVELMSRFLEYDSRLILMDLCVIYAVLARHLKVEPYAEALNRLRRWQQAVKSDPAL